MENKRFSERGQAIVLIVVAVFVLLGFTGLAIDGGLVLSNRRNAQNAADAASLAGGGAAALSLENSHVFYGDWECNSDVDIFAAMDEAEDAAIARAAANNFVIDTDDSDSSFVTVECGIDDYESWEDHYIDVTVGISETTETYFVGPFFGSLLQNRVTATTRVRPRVATAIGHAIVALSDTCGGVSFEGTTDVIVNGGGVFSNSCIEGNGNVNVIVNDGHNGCAGGDGCVSLVGGANITPLPEDGLERLPPSTFDMDAPNCYAAGMDDEPGPHFGGGSNTATISPGRYNSRIQINAGKVVNMEPGLYCLYDGIRINGGGTLNGVGVTIYVVDGDFDTNGGATVNIAAPPAPECNGCEPALPGVLIYMDPGNPGDVFLRGNADSDYHGVVYAPTGQIESGGTSSLMGAIHVQMIGWTVKVHGTTTVNISFDDERTAQNPSYIELYR